MAEKTKTGFDAQQAIDEAFEAAQNKSALSLTLPPKQAAAFEYLSRWNTGAERYYVTGVLISGRNITIQLTRLAVRDA